MKLKDKSIEFGKPNERPAPFMRVEILSKRESDQNVLTRKETDELMSENHH